MTGLTGMSIIQFYDHVFVSEYVKLKQFAHYNTDQLHTVYCNVKQRLEKSVIDTGKTVNEAYCNVLNYIRKSIANERRLEHKKKRDVRSITEDGYMYDAELQLNVLEEILEDDVVYRNQVNHIMANLWDFLDKYHDPYEIYVFKVYYFSGQKLSYKDISILLNIKEWKIDNILKATRKSIREKLIKYMEEKELYTQALENRDEVKMQDIQVNASKKNIDIAKASYYPTVFSRLEYGYNDNTLTVDTDKDYYMAMVGISITLFDNTRSIEKQKSQIEYQKASLNQEKLKDAIKLELKKAMLNLETKEKVLEEKIEAKTLANDILGQAKLQYKNRLISMTTLLQQEANFRKNEALLIQAKYEKSLALASLNLVLGKNIKEENN